MVRSAGAPLIRLDVASGHPACSPKHHAGLPTQRTAFSLASTLCLSLLGGPRPASAEIVIQAIGDGKLREPERGVGRSHGFLWRPGLCARGGNQPTKQGAPALTVAPRTRISAAQRGQAFRLRSLRHPRARISRPIRHGQHQVRQEGRSSNRAAHGDQQSATLARAHGNAQGRGGDRGRRSCPCARRHGRGGARHHSCGAKKRRPPQRRPSQGLAPRPPHRQAREMIPPKPQLCGLLPICCRIVTFKRKIENDDNYTQVAAPCRAPASSILFAPQDPSWGYPISLGKRIDAQ